MANLYEILGNPPPKKVGLPGEEKAAPNLYKILGNPLPEIESLNPADITAVQKPDSGFDMLTSMKEIPSAVGYGLATAFENAANGMGHLVGLMDKIPFPEQLEQFDPIDEAFTAWNGKDLATNLQEFRSIKPKAPETTLGKFVSMFRKFLCPTEYMLKG